MSRYPGLECSARMESIAMRFVLSDSGLDTAGFLGIERVAGKV